MSVNTYIRKQGDSLWIDITCANIIDVDPVWTNWEGTWAISASVGGVALVSGSLTRSATTGTFHMRLGPISGGAAWTGLSPGSYVLTSQIVNVTADYVHEEQDKLKITAQGILPVAP
jgi:hypothetical protein